MRVCHVVVLSLALLPCAAGAQATPGDTLLLAPACADSSGRARPGPCEARTTAGYEVRPAADERASVRDLYDLLDGRVPGAYVRRTSGNVGASVRLTLRGASHLLA